MLKKLQFLQQSPPEWSSSHYETFKGGKKSPKTDNLELLLITLSQQTKALDKRDYTHKNLLAPNWESKHSWLNQGQKNTLSRWTNADTSPQASSTSSEPMRGGLSPEKSTEMPMCERKAPPVRAAEQTAFTPTIYPEQLWHTV